MPTIAIIEDHLLLAETLQATLRQRGIDATVRLPKALDEAVSDLVGLSPDVTGVDDRLRIAAALEQGAVGFQPKALGFDALVATACAVLNGVSVLDPAARLGLLQDLARARAEAKRAESAYTQLTDREQGTLRALGDGRSVNEIAGDWVVAESTVRTHVRGVLVKLGVASQLAAVAEARRNGWLTPLNRNVPLNPR